MGGRFKQLWTDGPITCDFSGDTPCCRFSSGNVNYEVRSTIATGMAGMRNISAAYAQHLARNGAAITKLGERGPMFLKERG